MVKLSHVYLLPHFRHMLCGDLDKILAWFWKRFTESYEFVITVLHLHFNFSNALILLIPVERFGLDCIGFLCNYSLLWMSKMGDYFTNLKLDSF